jgi:hypothetical protein
MFYQIHFLYTPDMAGPSPHTKWCDFILQGFLKDTVYRNNRHTIKESMQETTARSCDQHRRTVMKQHSSPKRNGFVCLWCWCPTRSVDFHSLETAVPCIPNITSVKYIQQEMFHFFKKGFYISLIIVNLVIFSSRFWSSRSVLEVISTGLRAGQIGHNQLFQSSPVHHSRQPSQHMYRHMTSNPYILKKR